MRQGGTDFLAVACIVGGGVIAGGVTFALAGGPALPTMECATTVGADADVVMRLGDEGLVVVRPDVRVREVDRCMAEGQARQADGELKELAATSRALADEARVTAIVRVDRQAERERAREEIERAREEVDRVREQVEKVRDRIGERQVQIRRIDRAELAERVARIERQATTEARVIALGARAEAREEAARAREEAGRVRAEAVRVRAQAVRDRDEARRERDEVRRDRDEARRDRDRVRRDRDEVRRERVQVARIDADGARERVSGWVEEFRADFDADDPAPTVVRLSDGASLAEGFSLGDGLRIALPGRTLQVRFDGLESLADQLEGEPETLEVLQLQLRALRSLEFESNDDNEEIVREIESRILEEMQRLEARLERLRAGDEGR